MLRSELPGKLLEAWLYQKTLVQKRAGMPGNLMQWERAVALWGPPMERIASMIEPWDVSPGLIMEAAFASSRRKGHSQGPFLNAMFNERFLKQALSEHLDIPMERVLQMTRTSEIIAAIDRDYTRLLPSMLEVASINELDLLSAPNFPSVYRFFLLHSVGACKEVGIMRALAVDAIEEVEHDHRVLLWLGSRGISYDDLATVANVGVITTDTNKAAADLVSTALRLITGDQVACSGRDLAVCKKQAAELLRKAINIIET